MGIVDNLLVSYGTTGGQGQVSGDAPQCPQFPLSFS
jgi:hypothetical protein